MTWAARYSRTEQPELTIWRDGEETGRVSLVIAASKLGKAIFGTRSDLASDIAARVPVTECEEPGCVHWAMPDGRCHHLHGGSDEL